MSGIAAIFWTNGQNADEQTIDAMTGAMAFRGPDGIGSWHAGPAALGHCTLHTTAESLEAGQPHTNEDESLILIMDGYLTNWEELRRELRERGALLRNRSDAELILRAYEQWGTRCAAHIDGEFAFVIWDARQRQAYAARDHMGLRPLFYHHDDTRLIIASDLAGVLAALPQQQSLNHKFLVEMMANEWCSRDETIWSGIGKLIPAHWMQLTDGKLQTEQYWQLPEPLSISHKSDADYAAHYRDLLADCVRRASRTHRSLAFEVSGGLDSSALFAMADHLEGKGDLLAPEMAGYALAGPAGSDADETKFIHAMASTTGRKISEFALFMPQFEWFLEQSGRDRDIPYYPNASMMLDLYRGAAESGSAVCINGLGGDEWLGGGAAYYRDSIDAREWSLLGRSFRADWQDFGPRQAIMMFGVLGIGRHFPEFVKSAVRPLLPGRADTQPQEAYWLSAQAKEMLRERKAEYDASLRSAAIREDKLRTLTNPLNGLQLDQTARLRAQCQITGRSPMLSRPFIEFSAATPEAIRRRGKTNKYLHRRALKGLLPDSVLNRRDKARFNCAIEPYLQNISSLLKYSSSVCEDDLFDGDGINRLLDGLVKQNIDDIPRWPVWGMVATATLFAGLRQRED